MQYLKIKQNINISSKLKLFIKNNFNSVSIVFFLFLSLLIFSIDVLNKNYFSEIRSVTLNSQYMKLVSSSAQMLNSLLDIKKYFLVQKDNGYSTFEQNLLFKLNVLMAENQKLKNILSFKEPHNFITVTTPIIWKVNNGFINYGVIGIGAKDNIRNGQAVINENGLVGKIIDVCEDTAKILFIYNSVFRASIKFIDSGIEAVISGINDKEKINLIYLDESLPYKDEEYVVTSGDFPDFYPGIFVGKFKNPESVMLDIDWGKLDIVRIITTKSF